VGQEINTSDFSETDFHTFQQHLQQQTQTLASWFEEKRFVNREKLGGFELEACLVDKDCLPLCCNHDFMQAMAADYLAPELAAFNIEFNFTPQQLQHRGLYDFEQEMRQRWQRGEEVAKQLGAQLLMIGILPTIRNADLQSNNLSHMARYKALNDQVLRLRQGKPLQLDIQGQDILRLQHPDVMLESATTSFQVHFQVPLELSVRIYNASLMVSAPMVAVSANSPFFFDKSLWAETRIPLFEQSVESGGFQDAAHGPMRRVTFGSGYARHSLMECFQENLDHYPVLLASKLESSDRFAYVRLHNGTLWRWNRPLIGQEDQRGDNYHVRVEHRVMPAGPSVLDSVANAAFYFGLSYALANDEAQSNISFADARDNFYAAAKLGLDAHMRWQQDKKVRVTSLILNKLLPLAWEGLQLLGISQSDIKHYLGIIEQRVEKQCNGCNWQRAYVAKHGHDMVKLTQAYLQRQQSGEPVHDWSL